MKALNKNYTYEDLIKDFDALTTDFPDLEHGVIGRSYLGRDIIYIRLGRGENRILYNGAHHGMEWITSVMLMRFIRDFLTCRKNKESLSGFCLDSLWEKTSLYIVPMVNPDGVEIAQNGIAGDNLSKSVKEALIKMNGGSADFSSWQANARGVDLNHNYDALWTKSKAMEAEYKIFSPGPTRFSGTAPESEPESRALADFTRRLDFKMVIAFHSQGKVIYHSFEGKEPPYALSIARAFTKVSPYTLDFTEGIASFAGYKDWFIDRFNRPGYTVEVGLGKNPLPITDLPVIYRETLPIMLGAMTVVLP